MADNSTIARPYAKAVHDIASERGTADAWSELLALASTTAADEGFRTFLASPGATASQLAEIVLTVCGDAADELGRNFVAVLAENGRLNCLPDIRDEYERLRAESENIVDVELTSAVELSDTQKDNYTQALKERLGKSVRLHCQTDESLIGGAVIRAGDMVIDGSLRSRIERLANAVAH
ncbi:MAG: F0F1 ATP synthase subunit delta [Gammaproteobacteria bacterium]